MYDLNDLDKHAPIKALFAARDKNAAAITELEAEYRECLAEREAWQAAHPISTWQNLRRSDQEEGDRLDSRVEWRLRELNRLYEQRAEIYGKIFGECLRLRIVAPFRVFMNRIEYFQHMLDTAAAVVDGEIDVEKAMEESEENL